MRIEQIIAAVTRPVVTATVREIQAALTFADAARLHLWLVRMHLGMPAYSGLSNPPSLAGWLGRINPDNPGSKQGRLLAQPRLALASCPAGRVKV